MIKTEHFNPTIDIKLLCTCGKSGCDKRSVSQETLNRTQLVRDDANRPLTVNSGGRCPLHEDELARTTPADHQNCVGIDISVSGGIQRAEMVVLGLKHGFNAIGIANTFVHLGYREGEPDIMWIY